MKKNSIFLLAFLISNLLPAQSFQDTIPFRDDLGLIIIPISFNGVEKEFAFDTGAEYSLAYGWAKNELKSTRKSLTVNSSSGLRSKMLFFKSGTINLGSRKISGHQILNASENEIFTCYKIDGILGVDIIKNLNWKLDYKNKILIMYPSNYFPESISSMHELDFKFQNNRPYVFLSRKENRFRFLLDTGASGFSNISKKDYNLINLNSFQQKELHTGSYDVNGVFTETKPIVFSFPEALSKDVTLFPIVFYNDLKSSKIGNQLWKNQSLFLSLKNSKLYTASQTIKQAYYRYPCAISFQNGKMIIISIEKDSELWNLGVRQGDEVMKLNGKVFTNFCDLDQYRRQIAINGESFTIQLTNGKTITIRKSSSQLD